MHLGMTGQLRLVSPETPIPDHTHAIFTLDDGRQLRYRDPRRFGRLLLGTEAALREARAMPQARARTHRPGLHRRRPVSGAARGAKRR